MTLKERLYRTGEFAERAGVTVRTLRFYDNAGLLSPTARTESGYRLYSDADLGSLQQILGLKFLGFSLGEIRSLQRRGAGELLEMLEQQQRMLAERRDQINAILAAIGRARMAAESGRSDWDAIVRVIEVIQMDKTEEWVKKYFTGEQLAALQDLSAKSYSPEAAAKLSARTWTEEDQKRASARWQHVFEESERLAAAGVDPGSDEAQAVAKLKTELLQEFTLGDPEVEAGLRTFWENHNALPEMQQPLAGMPGAPKGRGAEFIERAMDIYAQRNKA